MCKFALKVVKGCAYQFGITEKQQKYVTESLQGLATTLQGYTKPEALEETNKATKELLNNTIDWFPSIRRIQVGSKLPWHIPV